MLKQDDEQPLEVFDWCGVAVARADSLEGQITSLSSRYRVAEDTIHKLNRQLEDFIRLKDQDHRHLVANFARLLNEKKLKIRNQQRLLSTAKVDSAKGKAHSHYPEANGHICLLMVMPYFSVRGRLFGRRKFTVIDQEEQTVKAHRRRNRCRQTRK